MDHTPDIPLTMFDERDDPNSYNFTSTPKRIKLATPIRQCNKLNSSAWSPICPDSTKDDSSVSAWSTQDVHSSGAWSLTPIRPKKLNSSLSSAWSPNFELASDDCRDDTAVNLSEEGSSAGESQEHTLNICERSIQAGYCQGHGPDNSKGDSTNLETEAPIKSSLCVQQSPPTGELQLNTV